jgi:predicted ArsR family transcriptional regulator
MDPAVIGVLIPIVALCIPIIAIWTKHLQRVAEINAQASAEKAAQYATHNSALEERVRVLERIVTDKGYDVGLQIEALRDKVAVENATKPGSLPIN